MCDEPRPTTESLARLTPHIVDDLEVEPIALEPVDAVHLTTLVDNLSDLTLLDQGPAKRANVISAAHMPRLPAPLFEQGETVDVLHAEHGFSMLVTIHKGQERSHLVFDTGMSPTGMAANMHRLASTPETSRSSSCPMAIPTTPPAWTASSPPSATPTSL